MAVAGADGGEDLGSPGDQLDPGGVGPLRQLGGNDRGGPWSAADPNCPVGLPEPLGVELADDPQDMADIAFLIRHDCLKADQIEGVIAQAVIPELAELREAFERAKPRVRELALLAEQ